MAIGTHINGVDSVWKEFFEQVFGCLPMQKSKKVVPALDADPDAFREAFEKAQPEFDAKVQEAVKKLEEDTSVPKAAKRVQLSMARRTASKLAESDYDEFIRKYIRYED